jgi:hypothetical protein
MVGIENHRALLDRIAGVRAVRIDDIEATIKNFFATDFTNSHRSKNNSKSFIRGDRCESVAEELIFAVFLCSVVK